MSMPCPCAEPCACAPRVGQVKAAVSGLPGAALGLRGLRGAAVDGLPGAAAARLGGSSARVQAAWEDGRQPTDNVERAGIQNALIQYADNARVLEFLKGLLAPYHVETVALEPPKDWKSDTVCEDELKGDNATCKTYVSVRTYEDFINMDIDFATSALKIKGATDEEEELLRYAWALLFHNLDVIAWAYCWLFGKDSESVDWKEIAATIIGFLAGLGLGGLVVEEVADAIFGGNDEGACVRDFIMGSIWTQKLTIRVEDVEEFNLFSNWDRTPDGNPHSSAGFSLDRSIWFFRGPQPAWEAWLTYWRSPIPEDKLCIAIGMAALLFHETMHLCRREIRPIHNKFNLCDSVYMAHSILQYGLLKRYPEATNSRAWTKSFDYTFVDDNQELYITNMI